MSYIQLKDSSGNAIYPNAPWPIAEVQGASGTISMDPGIIYQAGELSSVTIVLNSPSDPDYDAKYFLSFESGTTPTTVTWPSGLVFANSATPPTIVDSAYYEISIRDNLCIVQVYGTNAGSGGGGTGTITFDEITGYTPSYGTLRDNSSTIVPFSSVPYEQLTGSSQTVTLAPNKIYVAGELSSLSFSLGTNSYTDYLAIYHIRFESGSTATTVTWPSGLLFKDGVTPTIDPNKTYEVNIIDNLCVVTFYA